MSSKNNQEMKNIKYISASLFMAPFLLVPVSCNDWDDHYTMEQGDSRSQNLFEMLTSQPETSEFARLVSKAGYEDALKSSQTYTVFAPTNDALSGIDTASQQQVSRIVSNHIARYSNPTSTSEEKGIEMLNGKIYYFNNAGSFANQTILKGNELATNGVLHELGGSIPYAYNLYEYIENNPNTSKLYSFIHRFDEKRLDEEHSTEIDIDEDGRPVYDSVFVSYNRLLEDKTYGIGSLNSEDSIYTMVIPDNNAWDAAYARISPYFVCRSTDQATADSIQDVRTGLAIVNDLVYRGNHPQAANADSLISTSGSIIRNTQQLFGGTQSVDVSNGQGFLASALNYDNTETWNKPISVEGEEQNGRTYNGSMTSVYTESVTSSSLIEGVSGDSYIEVMPVSTTNNPTVMFDIPNVLAGTYNIYAVFLPATVNGEDEALDSTKISFTMTYQSRSGRATTANRSSRNITSGNGVTKMLAFENFTFPVSDYTDNLWLMDDKNDINSIVTNTTLSIATNVTTAEYTRHKYSRTYRLDRIILEPVKN